MSLLDELLNQREILESLKEKGLLSKEEIATLEQFGILRRGKE